ncbi:hypothetical protein [Marinobacter nauticus]|uniref:hypothetical protein n=1 Tax=Marinobacter nauticus TaxID=2743 RepID=UPI001C9668A6|nr:hypothetical protein [Marinobacter nauticus]MBY6102321.1 hypothetical protein [Marinobacter nauticus]
MRARNIKPGFWKNEDLVDLAFEHRLLFIGLWMLADREGRLEDRPKRIKMELFPCDNVNVEAGLQDLCALGLLERYEYQGVKVILISKFSDHQSPHHSEKRSELPGKNGYDPVTQPKKAKQATENGKGQNGKPTEDGKVETGESEAQPVDPQPDNGNDQERNGRPTVDSPEVHRESTVNPQNHNGRSRPDSLNPDSPNPESMEKTNGTSASDAPAEDDDSDSEKSPKGFKYPHQFELAWSRYPKRLGSNPKRKAYNCWNARLKDGHDPADMFAGVIRYGKFCDAKGKTGSELVMQGSRFFGPDCEFLEEWSTEEGPPQGGVPRTQEQDWSQVDYNRGVTAEGAF